MSPLIGWTVRLCYGSYFFRGAHLGSCQAGHHGVHQMGTLGVAQGGQVLGTNENTAGHISVRDNVQ